MDGFTLDIVAASETKAADGWVAALKSLAPSIRDAFTQAPITGELILTDDNPMVIPLGGMASVTFVMIVPVGGVKVRVRASSADGALSPLPVGRAFFVDCIAVPFTALDVTRIAGSTAPVRVQYFVGKNAA
jgi:hypothetical protein